MSNIFINKQQEPTDEALSSTLGETKELLDSIFRFIETEFGDFHPEWKYYGTKLGWSLKLFCKKRNVVFVGPENGYFRLAFAIGDKAYNKIIQSNLPDLIKKELTSSKIYVEGRPLRFEVRKKEDLEPIFEIIRIKLTT
ncbi:MAG: DUF3788 domain-containing protein [Paludibacter sp.]|jgi:hypothetical protein